MRWYDWIIIWSVFGVIAFLLNGCASNTMTGGFATQFSEDYHGGKVETCWFFHDHSVKPKSYLEQILSPITDITSSGQALVSLSRGPVGVAEAVTDGDRGEFSDCDRVDLRKGQSYSRNFEINNLRLGDTVAINSYEVEVRVN